MSFPVWIPIGPWKLHPHPAFEALAYVLAFRLFLRIRKRRGDIVAETTRVVLLAAAAVGAVAGAKLLAWLERPAELVEHLGDPKWLLGGKSVVGAFLGGELAVEIVKRRLGERRRTGDLFALPMALGLAVGRIGCFLSGLHDHTHGVATGLPWGVDFGDGVRRHPAQLYEILVLIAIAWLVRRRERAGAREGDLFRLFMVLYLAWRFAIEWLKPEPRPYLGLSGIQAACVLGLLYHAGDVRRLFFERKAGAHG